MSNGSGTVGTANVVSVAVFCPQVVGTLAYVVGAGVQASLPPTVATPGSISVYTINASSGALTLVPGSVVSTGPAVGPLQLVPHSVFALALNAFDPTSGTAGSLYDYMVDPTTGLLTPVAGSPFQTLNGTSSTPGCFGTGPGNPFEITFLATGAYGYVSNNQEEAELNDAVWQFTVDPTTGAPSLVPGGFVAAACQFPGPVTIDPSGQFAYVTAAASGTTEAIVGFQIDATTGALTEVPGSPFSTPGVPANSANGSPVTIDPTGRFLYAPVYIAPVSGSPALSRIYAFDINPATGALTPIAGSPFAIASAPTAMSIAPGGNSGMSRRAAVPTTPSTLTPSMQRLAL